MLFFKTLVLCLAAFSTVRTDTRSYPSGCNSCGVSSSYQSGRNVGNAVAGHFGNKLEKLAGFVDGLKGGGGGCNGGCGSCGSPGCGSSYVPAPNPCNSGGCYSGCGSSGCSSSNYGSSSHASSSSNTLIVIQQPSSSYSSGGYGSSSSFSSGGTSSSYSSVGSSSGGFNPSAYPNCQCEYLFNSAGQGNCNMEGARSHTSDRWCYVANEADGHHVDPQWACPDSVTSQVHHGRYWSRVACDTPHQHHGK